MSKINEEPINKMIVRFIVEVTRFWFDHRKRNHWAKLIELPFIHFISLCVVRTHQFKSLLRNVENLFLFSSIFGQINELEEERETESKEMHFAFFAFSFFYLDSVILNEWKSTCRCRIVYNHNLTLIWDWDEVLTSVRISNIFSLGNDLIHWWIELIKG